MRSPFGAALVQLVVGLIFSSAPAYAQCSFGFAGQLHVTPVEPGELTLVDLDGDSIDDLVVATFDGVATLPGQIDKGLGPTSVHPTGSPVGTIATGDFDGDGHKDVVAASADSPSLALLIGDGLGGFLPWVPIQLGSIANDLESVDLDGDGDDDLLALASGDSRILSLISTRGALTVAAQTVTIGIPLDIAVAELDDDDSPDLAVVELGTQQLSVFLGDGAGGFHLQSSAFLDVMAATHHVRALDSDFDGIVDLAVASATPEHGSLRVYVGTGDGGVIPASEHPTIGGVTGLLSHDLDLDGRVDLIVVGEAGEDSCAVHLAFGSTFPLYDVLDLPGDRLAIGDVMVDASPDLIVATDGAVSLFEGLPEGTFRDLPTLDDAGGPEAVIAAAAADFDNDGVNDVVTAGDVRGTPVGRVVEVSTGEPLSGSPLLPTAVTPLDWVATGDVDGDGSADAILGSQLQGFEVFKGDGNGDFTAHSTTMTPTVDGVLMDVNQDGELDVASPRAGGGVDLFLGDGTGVFPLTITIAEAVASTRILVDDLDLDGAADLVLLSNPVTFLIDGPIESGLLTPIADRPLIEIASGDLTGDAFPELIGVADGPGNGLVRFDNVSGVLAAPILVEHPFTGIARATISDLDGDGAGDVALRLPTSLASLRNEGLGELSPSDARFSLPTGDAMVVADFDGDGLPDVFAGGAHATFSFQRTPQGWPFHYGDGKPGGLGVPTLETVGVPVAGAKLIITVRDGAAGAVPWLLVGTGAAAVPFDDGTLLVDQPIPIAMAPFDGLGASSVTVEIPDDPSLCGFAAYFQAMFLDAGAGGPQGSAQTAGMGWIVGP